MNLTVILKGDQQLSVFIIEWHENAQKCLKMFLKSQYLIAKNI